MTFNNFLSKISFLSLRSDQRGSNKFEIPATMNNNNAQTTAEPLHLKEKESFLQLVSQTGEIFSNDKELILDVFLSTDGHISPEYVRKTLKESGKQVTLDLINETLEMFCLYGMAQKAKFNGSGVLYEHLHLGAHHDHILCINCKTVVEFFDQNLEALQRSVVERNGFSPLKHRLNIYGICPTCQKQRSVSLLSESLCGETIIISRFNGGRESENRLRSMGLAIGDTITVLNNSGPFIIAKGQNRLAIGAGMAAKIQTTSA
jgi:Fur family ferric uptake transcriptional regulator